MFDTLCMLFLMKSLMNFFLISRNANVEWEYNSSSDKVTVPN